MSKPFKSKVSVAEIQIKNWILQLEDLKKTKSATVEDIEISMNVCIKVLLKCEELRKKRDNLHVTISKLKRKLEEKT